MILTQEGTITEEGKHPNEHTPLTSKSRQFIPTTHVVLPWWCRHPFVLGIAIVAMVIIFKLLLCSKILPCGGILSDEDDDHDHEWRKIEGRRGRSYKQIQQLAPTTMTNWSPFVHWSGWYGDTRHFSNKCASTIWLLKAMFYRPVSNSGSSKTVML